MPFIDTVDPRVARDEIRAMYARQQASWGFVPNYAKAFSHRPEVLARWANLQAAIRRTIEPRRFELITLVVAYDLRNSACALVHGKQLLAWFSADEIERIVRDETPSPLSTNEAAMVRFARKVARDASKVTTGDVQALSMLGFDPGEIFDIVATVAGRAFFTKLLDGLGVEPDRPTADIDERLRDVLTVGRPVDFRAPARLPEEPAPLE